MTDRYHAPFAEQGSYPIDADLASRLLRVALDKGGDYADLFWEYSVSGSYGYDEQILKSARRAVSMGLGVRVMKGDATGYAYCEELSFEAMKRAAETAAQIAAGGSPVAPQKVAMRSAPDRYPVATESLDIDGETIFGDGEVGPVSFDDRGGNQCGCGTETRECGVQSANLEPPAALP